MSRYETLPRRRLEDVQGIETPREKLLYAAKIATVGALLLASGAAVAHYLPKAVDWVDEHRIVDTRSVYQAENTP